jgi:hypothetical protein
MKLLSFLKESKVAYKPTVVSYRVHLCLIQNAALGGLVVRVLAPGPSVACSGPPEDGRFLWLIKIPSAHFLRRGSKAVGPMS